MCSHETGIRKSVVSGSNTTLLRLRSLTIGDVFVNINSSWVNPLREQLQLTTSKKKESNWKYLYCQITCHVQEITEFVKQLPLFQSCIFI